MFTDLLNLLPPILIGLFIQVLFIVCIAGIIHLFSNSKASILIDFSFEKMYEFFSEVIGDQKDWVQKYVISLFFIILISNISSVFFDFISPLWGFGESSQLLLWNYIAIPSSTLSFNVAMAVCSIVVVLIVQLSSRGWKHFVYNYFPVFGKNYIPIEKGNMNKWIYYILLFFVKGFDIVISLFLAILDLISLGARIISLSLRLFGNMTSSSALLALLLIFMSFLTTPLFGGNFPILLPLLVYAQGILVAFIQALVFSLLIAVFIKVAVAE